MAKIHNSSGINWNWLGCYYLRRRDITQAKRSFKIAIRYGNKDAIFNLGLLYEELKKKDKAKKYYLMAMKKGNVDASRRYNNL